MKRVHSCLYFIASTAINFWLSNGYRDSLYSLGKSNFIADSGANFLVVGSTCSLLWIFGIKTTKSYTLDILYVLLFYEVSELASLPIPRIGTFDWQDMLAYPVGALVVWVFYLIFRRSESERAT